MLEMLRLDWKGQSGGRAGEDANMSAEASEGFCSNGSSVSSSLRHFSRNLSTREMLLCRYAL